MVITTNLSAAEWSSVSGNTKITTSLLDQLTRHCNIVETGNEFYLLQHSSLTAQTKINHRSENVRTIRSRWTTTRFDFRERMAYSMTACDRSSVATRDYRKEKMEKQLRC